MDSPNKANNKKDRPVTAGGAGLFVTSHHSHHQKSASVSVTSVPATSTDSASVSGVPASAGYHSHKSNKDGYNMMSGQVVTEATSLAG